MSDRLSDRREEAEFQNIRNGLLTLTGFDIGHYKPGQMLRLLTTIMKKAGAQNFPQYMHILRSDPSKIREFKNCITINVSEFFRDKHLFDFLKERVVPALLKELVRKPSKLLVWSAGCAGGEEPYSLAILLEERLRQMFFDYQILATDIDEEALVSARFGSYPPKALKNVEPSQMQTYFDEVKGNFQVRQKLKSKIEFKGHDLLKPLDRPGVFHLVLCRNVVIYFSEKAKEQVYRNLVEALCPGGVLFIGATENLLNYRNLGLEKLETYFYRKPVLKRD